MNFRLRVPWVLDRDQQQNNEGLVTDLNSLAQFFYFGEGAPTFTPPGAAIYFRVDPAVGAAVYAYDATSWTALV